MQVKRRLLNDAEEGKNRDVAKKVSERERDLEWEILLLLRRIVAVKATTTRTAKQTVISFWEDDAIRALRNFLGKKKAKKREREREEAETSDTSSKETVFVIYKAQKRTLTSPLINAATLTDYLLFTPLSFLVLLNLS